MSIQKTDIIRQYDISRDTIDRAIAKGELKGTDNGWFDEKTVADWAATKTRTKGTKPKPAKKVAPTNGDAPIPAEEIQRWADFEISAQAVGNAKAAEQFSKARTQAMLADEKAIQNMTAAGRLTDTREVAHELVDKVLAPDLRFIKKLPDLKERMAKELKLPLKKSKDILEWIKAILQEDKQRRIEDVDRLLEDYIENRASEVKPREIRR